MQKKLPTVDIKGKPYVLVNDRIKAFREVYPDYGLTTDIVELTDKRVVMRATIKNPDGVAVATGYAYEDANGSFINKSSYIENCETSAWGRALGNLGIGIDSSMCSADELANALLNQQGDKRKEATEPKKETPEPKTIDTAAVNTLRSKMDQYNFVCSRQATEASIAHRYGGKERFEELTYEEFKNAMDSMNAGIEKANERYAAKVEGNDEADREDS